MIILRNPAREIEVPPNLGVYGTNLRPGEIGKATGEGQDRLPHAFGGRTFICCFEAGRKVIVRTVEEDRYSDHECFLVVVNDEYKPIIDRPPVLQEVAFEDFNAARHGE